MAKPHVPVTGGCLCGAVRYESKQAPTQGYYCHCTICRKSYGGLFSATVTFPGAGFAFTKGELRYFRATSLAKRGFCADCGSPVAFFYEGNSNVWIKIGSLDHPEDWPMTKGASWGRSGHAHVDTKVPWHEIADDLPQSTDAWAEMDAAKAHLGKT
jgi:hypothetical protein